MLEIKEQQLLTELADRLRSEGAYGGWIDTNTMKVHDVPGEGHHVEYIKSRMSEWGIPRNAVSSTDDYYTIGHAKGLVRTVYSPRGVIVIDGMAKDLRKVAPIIMGAAMQEDVEIVRVNKVARLGERGTNMKTFSMPGQKGELQMFLRN